jgi:transposase
MANVISNQSGKKSKPPKRRRSKKGRTLQKPNGLIAPRVKKVGADKFALVCVDPAKHRSEWMMADYYGNLLVEPTTVEHQSAPLQMAIEMIRQAQEDHGIRDMIVTVERTGNYHVAPQRAFRQAGWEVRVVHPFATKQYRLPADAGNKTDATDLFAQHRAAVAGFGLCEATLDPAYQQLRLRVRHRRDLVGKSSALACQIREHLHLTMPRYAKQFASLLDNQVAMVIAKSFVSPHQLAECSHDEIGNCLRDKKIRFQQRTIEKIAAWARHAVVVVESQEQAAMHHAIWTDLYELHQQIRAKIARLEGEIAGNLVATPYIRLLAIPGINVVSAADLAGEMGPISCYANANAITGRSGLFPSRYQSDQTDISGKLVRLANRRLRAALMQIADNLATLNAYFRKYALEQEARGIDKRAIRVRIAKRFSRLAFACVAGDQPLRHACCRDPNSIIEKLRAYHYNHNTPLERALVDMESAVAQLPYKTRGYEAQVVSRSLEQQANSHRGPKKLGELLPSILAKLNAQQPNKTTREPAASD